MSTEPGAASPTPVECVIPILRVANLDRSVDYYTRVLGFSQDWRVEGMASVSRDRGAIMLCEGGQGQPGTWVWIGVCDAAALFAEIAPRGAVIRMPLANFEWAYEMQVSDPDGHVLRFGSEPLKEGT